VEGGDHLNAGEEEGCKEGEEGQEEVTLPL
jgi:hypothetical protein